MRLQTCVTFLFLFTISLVQVAKADIDVTLKGVQEEKKIFLATYEGSKIFLLDSVMLDSGKGVIPTKNVKGAGLYILYVDKEHHKEILISNDFDFTVYGSLSSQLNIRKIDGSKESEYFLLYEDWLSAARERMKSYQMQYKVYKTNKDSVQSIKDRILSLNKDVQAFIQKESSRSSTVFYSDFIRATQPVKLPKALYGNAKKDTVLWKRQYQFMVAHYFDHINLSNAAFVRTPILQNTMDKYLKDILVPTPDSIGPALLHVIEKSKQNDEVYKFVANYLLTSSINSKIMGMDKVFVQIASQNQLRSGQALVDSVNYKKIKDKVTSISPVLIGANAHNLHLQRPDGSDISLFDMHGQLHVVVFWEPNCSHCKKLIPELYEKAFTKYFADGVDFFAVNTQQDTAKWKNFLSEKHLNDWVNVYDMYGNSFMHHYYNVTTTPKLFLLDQDMKIVAKDIGVETLMNILAEKLDKK
ncbi:redoxin family protein [Halosquirtibacter laminarini]|uniref:Redoxin family protein n=1 Tax=Halosquirtibacter laminarini TaxID=3374600 RepID=A0AC61NIT9_9BACT|nr:redoxin family protein [Prolixibacteraceae bacterium]